MISLRQHVVVGLLLIGIGVLPQVSDAALSSEHFILDSYEVGGDLGIEEAASAVYTIHTTYGTEYVVAQPTTPPVPESEVDESTTQEGSRRELTDETEFISGGTTTPIVTTSLLDMLREAQDPRLTGVHERAFELAHGLDIERDSGVNTMGGTEVGGGSDSQNTVGSSTNGLAAGVIQSGTLFASFFASFWARFGVLLLVLIALWYVRTRTMFGRKYGPF